MKVLPPAVLALEAIVVALAIPVAVVSAGRGAAAAWLLALLSLLLVLASGMARKPRGVIVGSVLQVAVIATGLLVPAMALLGTVFLAVWITALVFGSKADRIAAANAAAASGQASGQPPAQPSGTTSSAG